MSPEGSILRRESGRRARLLDVGGHPQQWRLADLDPEPHDADTPARSKGPLAGEPKGEGLEAHPPRVLDDLVEDGPLEVPQEAKGDVQAVGRDPLQARGGASAEIEVAGQNFALRIRQPDAEEASDPGVRGRRLGDWFSSAGGPRPRVRRAGN